MGLEKYYENPALSQSKLKLLLGNPKLFNTIQEPEIYFEEKKYFTIGSAVDCLLTQSQEEFDNQYHISNIQNKPSDTIKSIINQVFDIVIEQNYDIIESITTYADIILKCCNEHEYQPKWNEQTRINKICQSWEYWEDLKQARGKKVLSQEENNLISQIVMSIRTNEVTSKYFQKDILTEIIFQMPIDFTYENISCKSLLDMVIVNHKDRTIQPIDIKTMGDYTINFPKSLRQNRLDIQAAFYTEALKSMKVYETYEILPFKFIVESTIDVGNPLVFTCSQELLNIGKYGRPSLHIVGTTDTNNYLTAQFIAIPFNEIKGFHQLIDDYKWYLENGFEKSKRVVESQGEFNLDWNGII
jgi:hypothetical protein